ncbi:MAG TPA: hypothetical protein VG101_15515 [Puia sp.]|jgi:hypothetical protein|nr:hypothetical protein [Puia sp.]
MLGIFKKSANRLTISGMTVLIGNEGKNAGFSLEREHVFRLGEREPTITVEEDGETIRIYRMQAIDTNPELTGQFLHSSIRILPNSAVMIDGIISTSNSSRPTWKDAGYEAVRFHPFYLSDKKEENEKLVGMGLFSRGLHFGGTVTPSGVRAVCVCDQCKASFTLQHFHAGFSEVQYFYSDDSRETLTVPYSATADVPRQLQKGIDLKILETMEAALPTPNFGKGQFRYYNSFLCPHCQAPFIDFEQHKDIRPGEYYGNTLINVRPTHWANI